MSFKDFCKKHTLAIAIIIPLVIIDGIAIVAAVNAFNSFYETKAKWDRLDEEREKLRKDGSKETNNSSTSTKKSTTAPTSNTAPSKGTSSSSKWSDVEDRAYEDGYRDTKNGGRGYYDPDCTGECADAYDDAYYEGVYDAEHGY